MSTDLAVIDSGSFLALQADGDIAEALQANLGESNILSEGDLTRVGTPTGGGTQWMVPGLIEDEYTPEITGILVYQCTRGVLWGNDDPEEGTLPVLVTDDLKTARMVSDEADVPDEMLSILQEYRTGDSYDWGRLPYNQWGSGKDGEGKRCKEQRVLFILRQQDSLPLIITIQPGSLKEWRKFIVELSKAGIPYYRAVLRLGLEKAKSRTGISYAKVTPSLAGVLEKEQGLEVKARFSDPLSAVARSVAAE